MHLVCFIDLEINVELIATNTENRVSAVGSQKIIESNEGRWDLIGMLVLFVCTRLTGDKAATIARWMEACSVRCQKKSGDCMFA